MATGLGFPAISTPNALDLRSVQTAVSNARQRIEALEALIVTLQSSTSTATGTTSSATLNALRAALAALTVRVTAIENWFSGDAAGIVVWSGSALSTRLLEAGTGITIDNPDGLAGNPTISAEALGGDVILYDNEGRAAIAADGGAIFEASGA